MKSVIDAETMEELLNLTPDEPGQLIVDLVDLFEQTSSERIGRIRSALTAGDSQTVVLEAHTLKSNAGNLGATDLQAACHALEILARGKTLVSANNLLETIEEQLTIALPELREWREKARAMRSAPALQ